MDKQTHMKKPNFVNAPRKIVQEVTVQVLQIWTYSYMMIIFQCEGFVHPTHVQGWLGITNITTFTHYLLVNNCQAVYCIL